MNVSGNMRLCFAELQSSYRQHHGTETALLKVMTDILLNMNSQQVILIVLLDLSAAFDTVNHDILLDRLDKVISQRLTATLMIPSFTLVSSLMRLTPRMRPFAQWRIVLKIQGTGLLKVGCCLTMTKLLDLVGI